MLSAPAERLEFVASGKRDEQLLRPPTRQREPKLFWLVLELFEPRQNASERFLGGDLLTGRGRAGMKRLDLEEPLDQAVDVYSLDDGTTV